MQYPEKENDLFLLELPFHFNGCQTGKRKLLITPGESRRLEVGERDNLRGSLGQLVKFWLDVIDSSLRIASFCQFDVLGVHLAAGQL